MIDEAHPTLTKKGKATDISKHIAEILVQYRRRKHLSQRHIAELIGVSFQQYQKYEKGKDRLSLERAIRMCDQLGIPLTVFTEDETASQGFGEAEQEAYGATTKPVSSLTKEEQELLEIYRTIPAKSKKDFVDMIKPIAKMVASK